jgi:hypothetical protein
MVEVEHSAEARPADNPAANHDIPDTSSCTCDTPCCEHEVKNVRVRSRVLQGYPGARYGCRQSWGTLAHPPLVLEGQAAMTSDSRAE